jgi:peptide deformylase
MALRQLVYFPDPVLLTPAVEVAVFDDALQTLIDDMIETMYHEQGAGLAAPQIGIGQRIAVIDVSKDKTQAFALINPEITHSANPVQFQEGCLSVPGARGVVERANSVHLKALDRYGKPYELDAEGYLAEAIQHEVDHLNGKLYIHLLSPFKRERIIYKMKKALKIAAKKGDAT